MRQLCLSLFLLISFCAICGAQQKPATNLPSNQVLGEDVPGDAQRTNSLPSTIAISPDGHYAAILNGGRGTDLARFQQSIAVLDLQTNRITEFPDERLGLSARQTYFLGLAFNTAGDELFASIGSATDPEAKKGGSVGNGIAVYSFRDGKITPTRFLKIAAQPLADGKRYVYMPKYATAGTASCFPAGLAVLPWSASTAERLLVACNLSDSALVLDSKTGQMLHSFDLSGAKVVPATYPLEMLASKDGKRAWVSLWNTSQVAELDLERGVVARRIELEGKYEGPSSAHPTAMTLSADEKSLYVALANRDSVAMVNLATSEVAQFHIRLPKQAKGGSYPVSVAWRGDDLAVACAGLNAVAIVPGAASGRVQPLNPMAFIPTEWYPTAVAVRGDVLLVANGKGRSTGPNNMAPREPKRKKNFEYIVSLLYGSVARVDVSRAMPHRDEMLKAVVASNRLDDEQVKIKFHSEVVRKNRFNRVHRAGAPVGSPIKHVIYIIKENRTYDQVFGDLGVGDGDKNLTLFGWDVAPNHHKLALQFGVLDNFYDSGEISGNGHVWSTAAITSDYTERTWPIDYRGAERSYDYEGMVGDEYPMQMGIPDIDEPSTGYLWTNAARQGLTYRHYGEFVNTVWCTESDWEGSTASTGTFSSETCARKEVKKGEPLPQNIGEPKGSASPWPWAVPMIADNVPTKPELVGHFDPLYADFKSEYPDQLRVDEFLREFEIFVGARKNPKTRGDRSKLLPELVVLRLPNDHTIGTKAGWPTPAAAVADNDLALGRIVEAVSNSPYWEDTAILVLEDDAQDGPDHVDAHRSLALLISKYAPKRKQPLVERRFFTTVNMIRTLEDLLGLPPMNIRDGYAAPIASVFAGRGLQPVFLADRRNLENGMIYEVNPPDAKGSKESAEMDFSNADAADAAVLNAILWKNRKGDAPMPEPRHTVIPER